MGGTLRLASYLGPYEGHLPMHLPSPEKMGDV